MNASQSCRYLAGPQLAKSIFGDVNYQAYHMFVELHDKGVETLKLMHLLGEWYMYSFYGVRKTQLKYAFVL